MRRHSRRVYRSRDPLRIILGILLAVILTLVIFAVGVFFGFRKYIVYTSDGLRVEVPWLQETQAAELAEEQE